jgi:hypothetical protein
MCASGASLSMSALDLLRFAVFHLRTGLTFDGRRLASDDAIASMIKPIRIVPPGESELIIGWTTIPTDKGRLVAAAGQTVEQNAWAVYLPGQDFALSVLTNANGGGNQVMMTVGAELLKELAGATLAFPTPPAPPAEAPRLSAADVRRYVGDYTNHTRARIEEKGGQLIATLTAKETTSDRMHSESYTLRPLGDHRFGVCVQGTDTVVAGMLFMFLDGEKRGSHFNFGNRIFARCDSSGRTGISPK